MTAMVDLTAINGSAMTLDTETKRRGILPQSGTTAENDAYTGALGELTYDTQLDQYRMHDGSTAGGQKLGLGDDAQVGAEMTFAAGLVTVASSGVAVKNVAVTAAKGDAVGFTVGTDNTLTPTYLGTKLLHVKGRFDLDVAAGAEDLSLHVYVGGASVYETAAQTVTALTLKQCEIDVLLSVATGDAIEIWGENATDTANIVTAAYSDRLDIVGAHGFLRVTGA